MAIIAVDDTNQVIGTACFLCDTRLPMEQAEMLANDLKFPYGWARMCAVCSSVSACHQIAAALSNDGGYLGPEIRHPFWEARLRALNAESLDACEDGGCRYSP